MVKLIPFAGDTASIGIGKLTVENGTDCVSLGGSLDITHYKQVLAHARALQALLTQTTGHLEAEKNLPDAVPSPAAAKIVANSFSRSQVSASESQVRQS